ncbi:MAG: hypothetical protein R2835_04335 [Thermomicrobiales bacterium]
MADHRDAERLDDRLELSYPFAIRAIPAADSQRRLVDPERVTAFDRARRLDIPRIGTPISAYVLA